MIVVAGLTPAWQQVIALDALRVGEVNRAREVHRFPSGKVFNVAMALHHLGAGSTVLSIRGGATGERMEQDLAAIGMRRLWVEVRSPTRVCTTVLDGASGRTTELVENGGPIDAGEFEAFLRAYADAVRGARVAVLTGSLPLGCPREAYRLLLERTPCPVVLDARGPELLEALPLRPLVVKPNREELGVTVGRKLPTREDLVDAMQELRRRGAQRVLVTDGTEPSCLLGPEGPRFLRPPRVEPVNPIGCGDCLAAGMALALHGGDSVESAVRLGMGAAAENAGMLLTGRLHPEISRRLAGKVLEG